MGYRVAARVVSAAEVGGSHTRKRLFILGHANRDIERQPSLPEHFACGHGIQDGPEPNGYAVGSNTNGPDMDVVLGADSGDGLEGHNLRLFPPELSNLAEWRKTLDRRPELKPCLHRLGDGMAQRVDRNAAAGNGVVPLAAAHAYCALRAELGG